MTMTAQTPPQTETKQQKHFRQFAILSISFSFIGLFIVAFLGAFGILAGLRALLLARHKDNLQNPQRLKYTRLATAGMILGVIDVALMLS